MVIQHRHAAITMVIRIHISLSTPSPIGMFDVMPPLLLSSIDSNASPSATAIGMLGVLLGELLGPASVGRLVGLADDGENVGATNIGLICHRFRTFVALFVCNTRTCVWNIRRFCFTETESSHLSQRVYDT